MEKGDLENSWREKEAQLTLNSSGFQPQVNGQNQQKNHLAKPALQNQVQIIWLLF